MQNAECRMENETQEERNKKWQISSEVPVVFFMPFHAAEQPT